MTNLYYNFDDPAISFSIVDAIRYNVEMQKITTAFDNFPPPVEFSSGSINYGAQPAGQPVNTYSIPVTAIPPATPYQPGNNIAFRVATTNTGPSQLQISSNGYRALVIGTAGALVAGDMRVPAIYTPVWDGTVFRTLEMSARYLGVAETAAPVAVTAAATAAAAAAAAANYAAIAVPAAAAAVASANAALPQGTAADNSRVAAIASANSAANSASTASTYRQAAVNYQNNAASSASSASGSASSAATSATAASGSASSAATSATTAANSATAAANANTAAQAIVTDPGFNARVLAVLLQTEMVVDCVEMFAANVDPNTIYSGTTWVRLPADVSIAIANATGGNAFTQSGSDTVTLDVTMLPEHNHDTPTTTINNATLSPVIGNGGGASFNVVDRTLIPGISTLPTQIFTTTTYDYGPLLMQSAGQHNHANFIQLTNSAFTGLMVYGGIAGGTVFTLPYDQGGDHAHTFPEVTHTHNISLPIHSHTIPALGPHHHSITLPAHAHTVALPDHNHTGTVTLDNGPGSGTAFSVVNSNLKLVAWRRTA